MRDAVVELGGDPKKINPICHVDFTTDHSVQVEYSRVPDALIKNQNVEFERNKERFAFLKVKFINLTLHIRTDYQCENCQHFSGVPVPSTTC